MEEVCNHAASLLTSLNLQREQAQFCDCVVRQKQSPGQLYPAHRCVLAASSPMLASILSSSGVLVELHLSDSVLELVLGYIYTGALPYTLSEQQYYNLLTAACYLQIDDLQEALRTEVNTADNTNASTGTENQSYRDINTKTDTCSANSLEREHQYCDDIDTRRSTSKTDAYHCNRKCTSPLSNASTSCSLAERSGRVNAGNYRQATYLTPQDLIQNIPCAAEAHGVSTEEPAWTAENRRHLYSRCTAEVQEEEMSRAEKTQQLGLTVRSKAGEKQTNRKEEDKMLRSPLPHVSTSHLKDKFSPLQHSSSSPHLCCGAVPVIRHSGRVAMAEVPPYHPVSQASVNSNRAPDLRLGSTDNDRIVEGITTEHKNHYEAQNRDYSNNKYHIGTQSWDCKVSSDQCAIQDLCYKSNADELDIKRQDYNSSNTDSDEYMGNGLSHITDHNDHHAHCDTFRNKTPTKHFSDDSVPQNKDCSSSTRERLDCSDCHNISNDPSVVAPLPVQDAGTGSDCEDLCPEGEAKEEQSYSIGCPTEMDRQDSHCNLYGLRYTNLRYETTSTKDANSSQHGHDNKDTAMDHNTDCTFLEHENMSGIEPHLTFTVPVDNNMSDPTYSVVGQSYRGHLHYHCLSQEDTHLSHRDSDHKHSHPSHPDHSDQSTDEEEEDDGSPGLSPLRQHFATTDQVLLLDISAKPAELLVSYKHRSDEGEKWVALSQKDTCGNGYGNNDREQRNEAASAAGVDKPKSWVGETNVEERKIVSKEKNRPGAEVVHKGENQTITWTACSPPSVPDSVQASVSSSLSVCIPSTLSASMPTNISAHLSTPVHHPFQCSLCERSFSQRGSLNRHVRSHLGVRPFPCPRCPMTFSRQYRVTEHMRVHQRCVLGSDFQKPPASSI
ncbi:uncharacterized protein LOC127352058 [Dicentrarchus labrax]|nr:uncharacterized protein LOC127352058 [Dicentrarchus labrax]